jgi:hypothetical protein
MKVSPLFPPGTPIGVLPSKNRPRLYFPSGALAKQWEYTSFYPAFKRVAKLYRLALRVKASSPFRDVIRRDNGSWLLGEFVRDLLPEARTSTVLVGTPGPTQKLTIQLWGERSVIGYVKYAEKPSARSHLANEHTLLCALPEGSGPTILKYAPFLSGEALLLKPVIGRAFPATLPPPDVTLLLGNLYKSATFEASEHPWLNTVALTADHPLDSLIAALSDRLWPSVYLHGDFAPWNLFMSPNGMRIIDWEYGQLEGFPYIDYCFYILQTGVLIYRWSPQQARDRCNHYLLESFRDLTQSHAQALITLAALNSFWQSKVDGAPDSNPLQAWRRALWKESP